MYKRQLKATADAGFYAPGPFKALVEKPHGIISLGAKMGEGWLLTAEMIELVQGGYGNIVCACLLYTSRCTGSPCLPRPAHAWQHCSCPAR